MGRLAATWKYRHAATGADAQLAQFEGELDRLGRAAAPRLWELACGCPPRQLVGSRGCLGWVAT